VVAPADRKNVNAIEKLISQTIPWIDSSTGPAEDLPVTPPVARKKPRRTQHASPVPVNGNMRASVDHREGKPSRPAHKPRSRNDGIDGHLPAFLLRPVRLKA
jgi:hypothetical protein